MIFFIIVKYDGQRKEKIYFSPVFREKTAIFAVNLPRNHIFVFLLFSPFPLRFPFPAGRAYIIININHSFPYAMGSRQIIFRLFSSAAGAEYPPKPLAKCETTAQGDNLLCSVWVQQNIPGIEKQAPVFHTPVFLSAAFAYCFKSSSTILRITAGLPWPPAAPMVCPMRACIACTFPER